jgi:hypothetical protein
MKFVLVTIAVAALVFGLFTLSGPLIGRYVQQQYARTAYRPEPLALLDTGDPPGMYRICGIPWISYDKAYCHTTALEMAARAYGLTPSVGELNFFSGLTYGAFSFGDQSQFVAYADPVEGTFIACESIGLEAHHLVTDDADDLLAGMVAYLMIDRPVIVQLNAGPLWGEDDLFPHTELIVGYEGTDFFYYETVEEDRYLQKADGYRISGDRLAGLIGELNEAFERPWDYSFIVLSHAEPTAQLEDVWRRNGELLIGSSFGPVANGCDALRRFAEQIRDDGAVVNYWGLEALSYTRTDNAAYLTERFPDDEDVLVAAGLLEQAGALYRQADALAQQEESLSQDDIEHIAALLSEGAGLEHRAGEIFLRLGNT